MAGTDSHYSPAESTRAGLNPDSMTIQAKPQTNGCKTWRLPRSWQTTQLLAYRCARGLAGQMAVMGRWLTSLSAGSRPAAEQQHRCLQGYSSCQETAQLPGADLGQAQKQPRSASRRTYVGLLSAVT